MGLELFQIDAFTERPFSGNPAGVCLLPGPADDGWMQNVARELHLPETAFVSKEGDGFRLRWFSPAAEVDLCGHATLAAAHALRERGMAGPSAVRFYTRSGILTVNYRGDTIAMDFPAEPAAWVELPSIIVNATGLMPLYCGRNRMDYVVEAASAETVRALNPDFRILQTLKTRGVIVTAASDMAGFDFISRFFAPAIGIDEDPVTGSAHCCLGPYWAAKLRKNDLKGYQASARGGVVDVSVRGERVLLSGKAVTVSRGEILV
ncbi:MAG TPA: PhzF family phenazine biosynthesis isomerase [Spirochaetota bacterium]|nr:PhzF family phenazine biosynthesis isomerase [Spirochaetota bacterium]